MFVDDYTGGAELTTEALIEKCPMGVLKLRSKQVNIESLQALSSAYWIFGNFSNFKRAQFPQGCFANHFDIYVAAYTYMTYMSMFPSSFSTQG